MADEQTPDWITAELRRAAATERAPTDLRLAIDALSQGARRRPGRRPARRWVLVPAAGLLAAVAVVLALVLPGGAGAPTVAQAAALVSHTSPGPVPAAAAPYSGDFVGVRFPGALTGGTWRLTGYRSERLDGRRLLVLSYRRGTQRLVYAVATAPLLSGQRTGYTSFSQQGHTVVSWREADHSCLLTSANVSSAELLGVARS